MQIPVEFLPIEECKVLTIIRIEDSKWNSIKGYLHYSRKLSKDYQSNTRDLLDKLILNGIKELYPTSLKAHAGGVLIDLSFRFTPLIPFDQIYHYRERFLPNTTESSR